jgi:hypothetical protein
MGTLGFRWGCVAREFNGEGETDLCLGRHAHRRGPNGRGAARRATLTASERTYGGVSERKPKIRLCRPLR